MSQALQEQLHPQTLANAVALLSNRGRMTYTEILDAPLWWLDLFARHTVKRLEAEKAEMERLAQRR